MGLGSFCLNNFSYLNSNGFWPENWWMFNGKKIENCEKLHEWILMNFWCGLLDPSGIKTFISFPRFWFVRSQQQSLSLEFLSSNHVQKIYKRCIEYIKSNYNSNSRKESRCMRVGLNVSLPKCEPNLELAND